MSRLKYILLNILLAILCCPGLLGQDLPFINYTVEDGLPSNETYSVHQDRKGFIWIGTDRGIVRYNGYQFEVFTTEDGAPDNTVFNFYEDHAGRIWFFSFNGNISFYHKGQFHHIEIENRPAGYIFQIIVSEDDEVAVSYRETSLPTVSFRVKDNMLVPGSVKMDIKVKDIKPFLSMSLEEKTEFIQKNNSEYYKTDFTQSKSLLNVKQANNSFAGIISAEDASLVFVDKDKNLRKVVQFDKVDKGITGLGRWGEGFFIATFKAIYIYEFDSINVDLKNKLILDGYTPTYLMNDNNNGHWVSTLNKGVLYFPNPAIRGKVFPDTIVKNGLTNYIKHKKVELVANKSNEVYHLSNNGYKKIPLPEFASDIFKFKLDKNRFLVGAHIFASILDNEGNIEFYKRRQEVPEEMKEKNDVQIENLSYHYTDFYFDDSGKLISCGENLLFIDGLPVLEPASFRLNRMEKYKDTIWVAGVNGLFAFSEKDKKRLPFEKDSLLFNRINDLLVDSTKMFLATRGVGLLIKQGKKIDQIRKKDGLIDNSVSKIIWDGKNTIWVTSNKGISRIRFTSFNPSLEYEIVNFGKEDGILSKQIKDIQFYNDSIFILAGNVLYAMDKDYEFERSSPPLYFRSLKVNGKELPETNNISLSYKQNNIVFDYLGLYFPNPKGLRYAYSIDQGENWVYTDNGKITFMNMATGDYTFMVRAITPKGMESEVHKLSFTIHPPWWKTWWALILYFLTAIIIVLGVVLLRMRGIRKKEIEQARLKHEREQNKRKQVELELKALRAQMNPHFTFNTMNSIQHFINSNNPEEAISYISRFSRLVRKILENSMEEYITVEQEMNALKLYLEIESLRFKDKFIYQIKIDEDIDESFERIPPMVIQPFCENAIWHGLMPKKDDKKLKIELKRYKDDILCVVEDNGIGRKKAQETKSELKTKHKSYGISITQTRLDLLNELNAKKINSKIIDLTDDKGNSRGTRVEILIPTK